MPCTHLLPPIIMYGSQGRNGRGTATWGSRSSLRDRLNDDLYFCIFIPLCAFLFFLQWATVNFIESKKQCNLPYVGVSSLWVSQPIKPYLALGKAPHPAGLHLLICKAGVSFLVRWDAGYEGQPSSAMIYRPGLAIIDLLVFFFFFFKLVSPAFPFDSLFLTASPSCLTLGRG